MTEEDSTSEEEDQPAPRRMKQIKSGMDQTEAATVLRKVTWPQEVMYGTARKSASCQDISIPQFVQGYLFIMEGEEGGHTVEDCFTS